MAIAGCATRQNGPAAAGTIRAESPERQARKLAALEALKELGPVITDVEVRRTKNIKGKQCLKYLLPLEQLLDAKIVDSDFTSEYYETEMGETNTEELQVNN